MAIGSEHPRPLLDLPAVAEWLGVGERHVRRLVQERRVPFVKWGHLLRFEPDAIESWIERNRRAEGSDVA
jgi:excisionase family DNA binding protein